MTAARALTFTVAVVFVTIFVAECTTSTKQAADKRTQGSAGVAHSAAESCRRSVRIAESVDGRLDIPNTVLLKRIQVVRPEIAMAVTAASNAASRRLTARVPAATAAKSVGAGSKTPGV